jgi:hypothetical protein
MVHILAMKELSGCTHAASHEYHLGHLGNRKLQLLNEILRLCWKWGGHVQ